MQEQNFFLFDLLFVFCFSDTHSFYFCTSFGKVAATSSGVNKALQAAVLFVTSHYIFCDATSSIYKEQCMNTEKIIGTVGVVGGVLLYALDTRIAKYWESEDRMSSEVEDQMDHTLLISEGDQGE